MGSSAELRPLTTPLTDTCGAVDPQYDFHLSHVIIIIIIIIIYLAFHRIITDIE